MPRILTFLLLVTVLTLGGSLALADDYSDTIAVFKKAGESAKFFDNSYGYAVFPSIAKGGLGIGAAHGKGRVYEQGKYVGDTAMTQVSVGLQAGGQAYSQIVFLRTSGRSMSSPAEILSSVLASARLRLPLERQLRRVRPGHLRATAGARVMRRRMACITREWRCSPLRKAA